jgi:hypothetical protein
MKAGLASNTVHVPDTWATYRVHPTQATAAVNFHSGDYATKIEEMIQDAFLMCEPFLAPTVVAGLKSHWLPLARDMRLYYAELRNRRRAQNRRAFQATQVFIGTPATRLEMLRRLAGKPKWPEVAPTHIREWLDSIGAGPVIMPE